MVFSKFFLAGGIEGEAETSFRFCFFVCLFVVFLPSPGL